MYITQFKADNNQSNRTHCMKNKKLPFKCEPNKLLVITNLALSPKWVTELGSDEIEDFKQYSRDHSSGWTIAAEVDGIWLRYVSSFVATHSMYGTVCGDFDDVVYATSESAYNHFVENHPPESFDYEKYL